LNRKISTGALTEGAILSALTALLGIISYYIPFLTLLIFIWPIPIIILGKKHGLGVSVLATISAGILLSLFTPLLYSVPIILMYGTLGIILGYGYYKNVSILKTILGGYFVSLLSTIILLQFYSMFTGINIMTEITQTMRLAMEEVGNVYNAMGMDMTTLEGATKQMEDMINQMAQLFPATLILIPAIVTMINMIASGKIIKRLGYDISEVPPFREWRLPNYASIGLFLIITIAILGQYLSIPSFDIVYRNLLYLTFILFTVQGLSFVAKYFHTKGFSKGFTIASVVMVFLIPIVHTVVQLLGLVDVVFNLRDKIKINEG